MDNEIKQLLEEAAIVNDEEITFIPKPNGISKEQDKMTDEDWALLPEVRRRRGRRRGLKSIAQQFNPADRESAWTVNNSARGPVADQGRYAMREARGEDERGYH